MISTPRKAESKNLISRFGAWSHCLTIHRVEGISQGSKSGTKCLNEENIASYTPQLWSFNKTVRQTRNKKHSKEQLRLCVYIYNLNALTPTNILTKSNSYWRLGTTFINHLHCKTWQQTNYIAEALLLSQVSIKRGTSHSNNSVAHCRSWPTNPQKKQQATNFEEWWVYFHDGPMAHWLFESFFSASKFNGSMVKAYGSGICRASVPKGSKGWFCDGIISAEWYHNRVNGQTFQLCML